MQITPPLVGLFLIIKLKFKKKSIIFVVMKEPWRTERCAG